MIFEIREIDYQLPEKSRRDLRREINKPDTDLHVPFLPSTQQNTLAIVPRRALKRRQRIDDIPPRR